MYSLPPEIRFCLFILILLKETKNNRETFFSNYTTPRAIALASYFWVKIGRGSLGVKKFCIIVKNNLLKKLKKLVAEKVAKSKKPKKICQRRLFFTPESQFLR